MRSGRKGRTSRASRRIRGALAAGCLATGGLLANDVQPSEAILQGGHWGEIRRTVGQSCGFQFGVQVRAWQSVLWEGYYVNDEDVDGVFGPVSGNATGEWQFARNLVPDGCVGRATWSRAGNDYLRYRGSPGGCASGEAKEEWWFDSDPGPRWITWHYCGHRWCGSSCVNDHAWAFISPGDNRWHVTETYPSIPHPDGTWTCEFPPEPGTTITNGGTCK